MPLPDLIAGQFFCTGQLLAPDVGAVVRLLLLAPLLEEWVVRAGLQEWLIQQGERQGGAGHTSAAPIVLSAAAFALLHVGSGWHAVLLVLAPGLVLAALYQRSRDWRLCALLHCGLNALAIGGCAL